MKVILQKLPPSQVKLDIEVGGEQSQSIYERLIKRLVANVQVPGFRKGKAPRELVLRQTGAENIKGSVLEQLIDETAKQALKENANLQTIGEFRVKSAEELLADFEIGKPFSYELEIDVYPEVTLKQYTGFVLKVPQEQPDLDYADQTLHQFRVRKSTLVPVDDRPAQLGDVATINIEVFDPIAGKMLSDFSENDLQIDLEADQFIPEVVQALVGANGGDEVETIAKLPTHLCPEELKDRDLRFVISLNDLKSRELPPLDDEFAQSISTKETMADLRAYLDHRAAEEAQEKTENITRRLLLDALLEQMEAEIPLTLIQQELNALVSQQLEFLQSKVDEQSFKQLLNNREMLLQIAEMAKPEATVRVQRSLALSKVAQLEKITVTEAEIQAGLANLDAEIQPTNAQEQQALVDGVASELTVEKTIAWLLSQTTIEYINQADQEAEPELEAGTDPMIRKNF